MSSLYCIKIKACIISWFYLNQIIAANDCVSKTCSITCSGDYSKLWAEQIEQIATDNNCATINLELLNSKFNSKVLPSDWLKTDSDGKTREVLKIQTLKFTACNFESIEPDALSIAGLETLHFSYGAIEYFKKEFFNSLPALLTFNLDNCRGPFLVEECLFENASKMETLSIENCEFEGELIGNITGQNGSPTPLQNIALRYNRIHSLPDLIFSKAKKLRSIYLDQNDLQTISKKAFWVEGIQKIDLTGNYLTTLENGTFDYVRNTQWATGTLIIDNNPWKCDCNLKWLQDLYFSNDVVIDPVPKCDDFQSFTEASFECETETTTSSSNPTSLTTSSTELTTQTSDTSVSTIESTASTPPNPNETLKTLECKEVKKYLSLDDSSREFLRSVQITFAAGNNELVKVDIYSLDDDPQLELVFTDKLTDINLVYFEIFDSTSPICIANINKSVYLDELRRNHTYTFCLLAKNELTVPPSNCFGLQIPPDWEDRSWITNKNKILIIGSITGSLILCAAISGIIAFIVIRTYPTLIDGNKDVVILKHSPKVQPTQEAPNFERPEYAEPIRNLYNGPSQSGYLTPASNYEKINYYTRRMNSTYGGQSNSYIRPGYSGGCDGTHIDEVEKLESFIFSSPPPLPKLNQMQDKIYY
ncbi:leucine-rich repeat transmembrane protein FLRT2-like [Atheta coriaria]|uniref:leucine-rich repeat transmembrane protein FLRT2-like n=1 Tax=Dalotia coriaria TaxID=877792 RepID=UPI0031F3E9FF